MTDYFVDSSATGAGTGLAWDDAFTTFGAAAAVSTISDRVLIYYLHSSSESGSMLITASTVISCDKVGLTGFERRAGTATQLTQTSSADVRFNGDDNTLCVVYGLIIIAGRDLVLSNAALYDCDISIGNSNATGANVTINSNTPGELNNTIIQFVGVTASPQIGIVLTSSRSYFVMRGGAFTDVNASYAGERYLVSMVGNDASVYMENVDCSVGGRNGVISSVGVANSAQVYNCKLNSNIVRYVSDEDQIDGQMIFMGCNTGSETFQSFIKQNVGVIQTDSSITLGADFSWLFSGNVNMLENVTYLTNDIWSGIVDMSTTKTFTTEVAIDGSTDQLTDADVWLEISYRGAGGVLINESSQAATISGEITHPTSTASWVGLSGTNSKQTVSITSSQTGIEDAVIVKLCYSKETLLLNVDPDITVS